MLFRALRTVAFHLVLQLFPLRPQLVLLELRPKAVRSRRGALALWRVVVVVVVVGRRRDARAVRGARGQRLAVAEDVFDEEGRGGCARGGTARQRVVLAEVEEVVLVVEAVAAVEVVVMGMQRMLGTVRGVHGN